MKKIAMIPARMGSERLPQKNLRSVSGFPLISWAIQRCKKANCFDEIWVNSENSVFKHYADEEAVNFHERPSKLGDSNVTSEEFVAEFLDSHHCEMIFQVHTIAPLLGSEIIKEFVTYMIEGKYDTLLAVESMQLEYFFKNSPLNFSVAEKTNSQHLEPIHRIN